MIITRQNISIYGGQSFFVPIVGDLTSLTNDEKFAKAPLPTDITVSGGVIEVVVNTFTEKATLTIRKNGSNTSMKCEVLAGQTGQKLFTGSAVDFFAGDYINYKITTDSGDGDEYLSISFVNLDAVQSYEV